MISIPQRIRLQAPIDSLNDAWLALKPRLLDSYIILRYGTRLCVEKSKESNSRITHADALRASAISRAHVRDYPSGYSRNHFSIAKPQAVHSGRTISRRCSRDAACSNSRAGFSSSLSSSSFFYDAAALSQRRVRDVESSASRKYLQVLRFYFEDNNDVGSRLRKIGRDSGEPNLSLLSIFIFLHAWLICHVLK